MRKKIVITGISSPLMYKVALSFDSSIYDVIGICRDPHFVAGNGVKTIHADIRDTDRYSNILENCFLVIYGAGITHTKNKQEYFEVNYELTQVIVNLVNEFEVKRFIYISSNTAGDKSGYYGQSKFMAENYIKENLNNWMILRFSEVFGSGKNTGIDKLISDVYKSRVLVCPANVPYKFYPIYIDDAVHHIINLCLDTDEFEKTEVLNGSQGFSYLEVIRLVAEAQEKSVFIITIPKFWMMMISSFVKILPKLSPIAPDQIDRLYAKKDINFSKKSSYSFEKYVVHYLYAN